MKLTEPDSKQDTTFKTLQGISPLDISSRVLKREESENKDTISS